MADKQSRPNLAALRKLEASLRLDLLEREVNGACAPNTGMPINGDHPMHPFAIDAEGNLFVSMGSATNAPIGIVSVRTFAP